jgi:hypothetical protein
VVYERVFFPRTRWSLTISVNKEGWASDARSSFLVRYHPFGHHWSIAEHLEDLTPMQMQERMAATMGGPPCE